MPRANRGGARAAAGAVGGVLTSCAAPFALRVSCYRIMQKLCDAIHTVLPKLMDGTQKRTVPAPGTIRSSLIFCTARLAFLCEKELHSPFEV